MSLEKTYSSVHPTVRNLFRDRKMMICSMHGKALVMRPLIRQYLNVEAEVVRDFDTDEFGTFSGEVERPFDPVTTLRKKNMKGLALSGQTLGIGNEGSFGPHPKLPFVAADQELVMLIDLKNDLEFFHSVISTRTNHHQSVIHHAEDLQRFAEQIEFPLHGMILKREVNGRLIDNKKGIITWDALHSLFSQMRHQEGTLLAESDMRARVNPTRMKVIEEATALLMKKIISSCPHCQYPGFGIEEVHPGLPCQQCGSATKLPYVKVYRCQRCHFPEERIVKDSKADPDSL